MTPETTDLTSKTFVSWTFGVYGSVTRGYTLTRNRKWISWSRHVKPWANKLTKAEACYLRQKSSGCKPFTDWKQGLDMKWEQMWVRSCVSNVLSFIGLVMKRRYKTTNPDVFLHDRLDGSSDGFTDAQTVMTFIVRPPFDILCFACVYFFNWFSTPLWWNWVSRAEWQM